VRENFHLKEPLSMI